MILHFTPTSITSIQYSETMPKANIKTQFCSLVSAVSVLSSSWDFRELWKQVIIKLCTNYLRCLIQLQSDNKNTAGRRITGQLPSRNFPLHVTVLGLSCCKIGVCVFS